MIITYSERTRSSQRKISNKLKFKKLIRKYLYFQLVLALGIGFSCGNMVSFFKTFFQEVLISTIFIVLSVRKMNFKIKNNNCYGRLKNSSLEKKAI